MQVVCGSSEILGGRKRYWGCGRTQVEGDRWEYQPVGEGHIKGLCKRCGDLLIKAQERAEWQQQQRTRFEAERGYRLDPDKAFEGIKYDAEREGD